MTSAYDIALMSRQLLKHHPDIKKYTTIWMDTVRNGTFGLANTNKLVRFYPGATGLKTGFTNRAGFCLAVTCTRNGETLLGVMTGFKSLKERDSFAKALLNWGYRRSAALNKKN